MEFLKFAVGLSLVVIGLVIMFTVNFPGDNTNGGRKVKRVT